MRVVKKRGIRYKEVKVRGDEVEQSRGMERLANFETNIRDE